MPYKSYRSVVMDTIRDAYERSKLLFIVDQILDGDDDSISIDSPTFLSYLCSRTKLEDAIATRYFKERTRRICDGNVFENDLHHNEDGNLWMNDEEFKQKYRVTREMLDEIC